MAGKSVTYTVLLLTITALAAAACSSPVGMGSVGGTINSPINPNVAYDNLFIRVANRTYRVGDYFQRGHLQVTTINDGESETVPLAECEVYIEDPGRKPVTQDGYELANDGTKVIVVKWVKQNLLSECTIEVLPIGTGAPPDPTEPIDPGPGPGGQTGIIIKWEE